jgi:DNA polymerase-3 subunit gamma/tau
VGKKKNPESLASGGSVANAIVPASVFKDRKVSNTQPKPLQEEAAMTGEPSYPNADSKNRKNDTDESVPETVGEQSEIGALARNENHTEITVGKSGTKIEEGGENDTEIAAEESGIQVEEEQEYDTGFHADESQLQVAEPPLKTEIKKSDPLKKVQLDLASKRVSALSISSLKAKKQHKLSKKEEEIDESQLPKEDFTEKEMQKHWADFVEKIDGHGRKILASSLTTDVPKLFDETTIWIELPNDTMKKEVEREQHDLIDHLKRQLNNHLVSLRITVNEETAKKFAFTPEEKYRKLREKNPAIDLLRKTFDLDL